jgi:phage-related protein (TIGR01555 family)
MSKSTKRKSVVERKAITVDEQRAIQDLLGGKMQMKDAFQNQMARLGFGQPNLTEGAQYPLTRLTPSYFLFNSLYRGSWIVRKIIDTVPSDMMKNWVKVTSQVTPRDLKAFNQTLVKTRTREKILEGLRWGRLYGGAGALILIDGQDDFLDLPLNYDYIQPGDYKGLLVFDRWSGIFPKGELIRSISDPDFGLPKYYTITTELGDTITVHHSRIIRFQGRELPFWEKHAEMYWGESEVEVIYEELKKRDNTSANLAYLIFLANLRVLKMNDLGQLMGSTDERMKQVIYETVEAQNMLMSNMGVYLIDKEDDFETKAYSFSGINDVYESFMLDIAGACEMPVTKLFGRSPQGLNATGESDLEQYDETIEEKQRAFLAPALYKLLPIVAMSTWGAIPEDFDWEFNPVRSLNDKDRVELARTVTENVSQAVEAGLVSPRTALKELKQSSDLTGVWTNITDEDILKASDKLSTPEERESAGNQQEIAMKQGPASDPALGGEGEPPVSDTYQRPNWLDRFLRRKSNAVKSDMQTGIGNQNILHSTATGQSGTYQT